MGLPKKAWAQYKSSLAPSLNCECDVTEQTTDHVISACPTHQIPQGVAVAGRQFWIAIFDAGLMTSPPASDLDST